MLNIPGFHLTQVIYEGSHTLIYKGIRELDNQKVIIKCLNDKFPSPELLAQFNREYKILSSLQGIGTAKVLSSEIQGNNIAIVMQDENYHPLKELLDKPINLTKFFKLAIQLIEIIEIIHSRHIIHKDLNPYNILIHDDTDKLIIIDFGISTTLLKEDLEMQNLQKLEGMLDYISPEQTGRMNRTIDYRTDFYSVGINFYEMLTGKLPFQEKDILELVHSHLAVIPNSVCNLNPSVPPMVGAIVTKLLSKIPEDRYSSAIGLKEDLLECQRQWEANKTIENFRLGQKDINDHLIISQKLYGREAEINQLLNAFENVCRGENKLLFIGGYSGIGKTSLVKEVYKPITRRNGYIGFGKFNQLQRSTPYSAFFDAFQGLIRFLLTESEDKLRELKEELLGGLGNNGQVLIEVIPNVELIIGPQPAVTELSPAASKSRFLLALQNFVRALAQKHHPLVIFLDDLQWADSASLQLIQLFLTDRELHYFLIIGAYRDNEINFGHPLDYCQEQLKKANVVADTVSLKPLKLHDINQLLADSLNISPKKIGNLGKILLDKTHGNPFYLYEFLRKLQQNELLNYSYLENKWCWDLEKIQHEVITDNVVDLLIARINTLPEEAKYLLELAACIGHTFDLETLYFISETSIRNISKALLLSTQAAFITPLNKNYQLLDLTSDDSLQSLISKIEYRFVHDRIQQAAYQLIAENTKKEMHLRIGRLLLKNRTNSCNDEQMYCILNHFNESLELIKDSEERYHIAELNLWAGKKARISAAYQSSKKYLTLGLVLIKQIFPNEINAIYFESLKELAISQFLTGEFTEADANFDQLLKQPGTNTSKIEIYKLYCQSLAIQNKHIEAFEMGRKALKTLSIHIPQSASKIRLLWVIFKIYKLTKKINLNTANLPLMRSSHFLLVLDLLGQITVSTVNRNEKLGALLSCMTLELSFKHGYSKNTTTPGLLYASILIRRFKARKFAFKLADFFNRLENKYNLVIAKSRPLLILTFMIDHWRLPLEKCYDNSMKCYQLSIEEGEYFLAIATMNIGYIYALATGKKLTELANLPETAIHFLEKNKMEQISAAELYKNIFDTLLDVTTDPRSNILERYEKIKKVLSKNHTALFIYYVISMQLSLLHDLEEEAKIIGKNAFELKNMVEETMPWVLGKFFYGLGILTSKNINRASKKILREIHSYLKRCTLWQPDNFKYYLLLFEAELARTENRIDNAMELYNKCLHLAESSNILPNIGLVSVRAGKFYLSLNLPELAQNYFLTAHYAYQHWGAKALSKQLENKFPEWFKASSALSVGTTTTIDTSVSSLDVLSLLRATQVISSEIQLEPLLKKLILVLLQNAGAQRGALIMYHQDTWYVAVEGTTEIQRITLIADKTKSIDNRSDLPLSLIRYVQRTQEYVQAQSDYDFEAFSDDPYIKEIKPKSIIVLPINYQNKMTTILFLENRTTSHAFTPEHVHILKVLSSQAVISLENAKLYYQATHDPLTGLANRNLLYQMFELGKSRAKRQRSHLAILFLDLDGFKKINDTLGHEIGDHLLKYFAERLKLSINEGDLAVRLGGDEFIAMVENTDRDHIATIAAKLLDKNASILIQGHDIQVGTSIGISFYPELGETIQELLKQADVALYHAKALGKGNFQFYTKDLDRQLLKENRLEVDLVTAIERDEFIIFYQPVYSTYHHTITHFEALLRWDHPTQGLLETEKFIHLAESSGLILSIGKWIFETVFNQMNTWKELNFNIIPIAINISGLQFKKISLSDTIAKLLLKYKIENHLIQLEFTENIFIGIDDNLSKEIKQLKKHGIKLTLDDFGSHYSSLSYLRQFEIDQIKIDQSFIHDIHQEPRTRELILSIIKMAHNLDLFVIAKGVETEEQMLFLESNKVDAIQGFYLSKPLIAAETSKLLTSYKSSEPI